MNSLLQLRIRKKNKHIVQFFMYGIPFIYGILYIWYFGVDIPQWDDWGLLERYFDFQKTGHLTFSLMFTPNNGDHIMFFPNLLAFATLPVFHWNTKIAMYESLFFLFFPYTVYIKRLEELCDCNKKTILLSNKFLLFSVLAFFICYSPVQWENFLWAFQTAWFILVFCSVLSFYFFNMFYKTKKIINLIISVLCMIIGCFSSMQGLGIGCAYIAMFFIESVFCDEQKDKNPPYILTISIFIICTVIYLINYKSGELVDISFNVLKILFGYLVVSGSIAAPGYNFMEPQMFIYACIFGLLFNILSLMTVVYLIKKHLVKKYRFELLLMIYSVIFRLMVSIGRVEFGYDYLLGSRFSTFVLLNLISLVLLFFSEWQKLKIQKTMIRFSCILFLAFAGYSVACFYVSYTYKQIHLQRREWMLNYKTADSNELFMVCADHNIESARKRVEHLDKNNFSAFYKHNRGESN